MRGFIRIRTLIWLVVLVALGIVAMAYGKAGMLYYRIDQEAHTAANAIVASYMSEKEALIRLMANIDRRCAIEVPRSDIQVERERLEDSVTVVVTVAIPIHFIVVDKTIYRRAFVKVTEKRLKDYN